MTTSATNEGIKPGQAPGSTELNLAVDNALTPKPVDAPKMTRLTGLVSPDQMCQLEIYLAIEKRNGRNIKIEDVLPDAIKFFCNHLANTGKLDHAKASVKSTV